jgi:hypothetical protein
MNIMPNNFVYGHVRGRTLEEIVDMNLDSFHFFLQMNNFPPELFNYLKHLRDEHIKEVSYNF